MAAHNRYFKKFPLISYNGVPAVDILTRVDFNSNVRKYFDGFYQYTLSDAERIEDVAFNLYKDVDLDWLLLHANDIIDPYFDVPLDNQSFDRYIIKKYGSIATAQQKVYAYRNNWRGDDSILSVTAYEALSGDRKKYWSPAQGALDMTIGYERSQEDFLSTTNQVISISAISTETDTFTTGTFITASNGASAQIAGIDNGTYTLQHIEGTWDRSSNFDATAGTTTVTLQADTYKLLQDVIPNNERIYYSKYSNYQYEFDVNERRRDIYLVNEGNVSELNKQLTNLLK